MRAESTNRPPSDAQTPGKRTFLIGRMDAGFPGPKFHLRPGHSLKSALPSEPVAPACALSIAEILDEVLCLRSWLAECDPPMLAEPEFLTPQQDLGTPIGGDVSAVRALVSKDKPVLASVDDTVLP